MALSEMSKAERSSDRAGGGVPAFAMRVLRLPLRPARRGADRCGPAAAAAGARSGDVDLATGAGGHQREYRSRKLVTHDAGFRPLAVETETALPEHADPGGELRESLPDHARDRGKGEGPNDETSHHLRGVPASPLVFVDPVTDLHFARERRRALVSGAPDERLALRQDGEMEPPACCSGPSPSRS